LKIYFLARILLGSSWGELWLDQKTDVFEKKVFEINAVFPGLLKALNLNIGTTELFCAKKVVYSKIQFLFHGLTFFFVHLYL